MPTKNNKDNNMNNEDNDENDYIIVEPPDPNQPAYVTVENKNKLTFGDYVIIGACLYYVTSCCGGFVSLILLSYII